MPNAGEFLGRRPELSLWDSVNRLLNWLGQFEKVEKSDQSYSTPLK